MKQINPYKAFFTVFIAGLLIPPFAFFIIQVWYSCLDPAELHNFIDRIKLLRLAILILAGASCAALVTYGACLIMNSDKLKKGLRITVILLMIIGLIWLFFNPFNPTPSPQLQINIKKFALQALPVLAIGGILLWLLKE
jgi:hypothetical protein